MTGYHAPVSFDIQVFVMRACVSEIRNILQKLKLELVYVDVLIFKLERRNLS